MSSKAVIVAPGGIRPVQPPMPLDLRLRRSEMRAAREMQKVQLVSEFFRNPIVELIVGFAAVEMLQRYPEHRPIIGPLAGTTLYAGIVSCVSYQQLQPALPYISQAFSDVTGIVKGVLPLALK